MAAKLNLHGHIIKSNLFKTNFSKLLWPGALIVPGEAGDGALQLELPGLDPPVVEAVDRVPGQQGGGLENAHLQDDIFL